MVMAFVHPAAVVPIARLRRVDGAALVAGSVGPDVADYFARLSARPWLHLAPHLHPERLVAGGLVGALAVLALVVASGPGVALALPPFLGDRFGPALSRPLAERRVVDVALGLVVGVALHVAWDAVTERHGLAHALWPGVVPWRALYWPTTALGLAVLGAGIATAPRASPVAPTSGPTSGPTSALDVGRAAWGRPLVVVVAAATAGAALLAAVRLVALGGSVPDAMAAASAGALVGVALAGLGLRARVR